MAEGLGRVKEVGGRPLRLACVHKELDSVGVGRETRREDELEPVRIALVGAQSQGIALILEVVDAFDGVVAEAATNRRVEVGGAPLAQRAERGRRALENEQRIRREAAAARCRAASDSPSATGSAAMSSGSSRWTGPGFSSVETRTQSRTR